MGEPGRLSNAEPCLNYEPWHPSGGWEASGLCYLTHSALFFPPRGGDSRPARRVCARCPVWEECLIFATFTLKATDGIWGGSTVRDRQSLRVGRLTIAAHRAFLNTLL